MEVHSIIFDNKKFDTTAARNWLRMYGYMPIKHVDKTKNYLRYRIRDPKLFKSFVIKEITDGVKFVFGIK